MLDRSKLAQCGITMLDAPNDMFTVAFYYLGLDPNSQRREDWAAAAAVLTKAAPYAVEEANGNAASLPFVAESLRNDPSIYPTSEAFNRLYPDQPWPPEMNREIARAWTRIKTGE